MWIILSLGLLFSGEYNSLCNPDQQNGWDYLLCVKFKIFEAVAKVEPGPEQADAFTYAFAEINRAQRKIIEDNKNGVWEDARSALMMALSYEYMGELSAMGGDYEKARLITEFALLLTAGTGEELYKRKKIAGYYATDAEIQILEGIVNRPGFLNESLSRGRADAGILRTLAVRYTRKGKYQKALDLHEHYIQWVVDQEHPSDHGAWNDYLKLVKKAKPKFDAKKREKLRKKYAKLLKKERSYPEYEAAEEAEAAVLAANWRRFREMDNYERRMAIRAMDY